MLYYCVSYFLHVLAASWGYGLYKVQRNVLRKAMLANRSRALGLGFPSLEVEMIGC